MRDPTIARNYAETLVALAQKAGDLVGWGTMMSEFAEGIQRDPMLLSFLRSPRIDARKKNEIIARALQDRLPRVFVRFVQAVFSHRRQELIPEIAVQYQALVDDIVGRVHAQVTVARDPDASTRQSVSEALSRKLGKQVVPHFMLNPAILGGVVVRVGDTVMDGSVRRRLATLRSLMLRGATV
jgi:F-type H+-transporting ATPase subunit delta